VIQPVSCKKKFYLFFFINVLFTLSSQGIKSKITTSTASTTTSTTSTYSYWYWVVDKIGKNNLCGRPPSSCPHFQDKEQDAITESVFFKKKN